MDNLSRSSRSVLFRGKTLFNRIASAGRGTYLTRKHVTDIGSASGSGVLLLTLKTASQ